MREFTVIFILDPTCRKVLMILKLKGPFPNRWNGIGGKLEPGETPDKCNWRETGEEIGLEPIDFETYTRICTLTLYEEDGQSHPAILHVYGGVLGKWAKKPQKKEEEPIEWMPIVDILKGSDSFLAGDGNIPYFLNLYLKMIGVDIHGIS